MRIVRTSFAVCGLFFFRDGVCNDKDELFSWQEAYWQNSSRNFFLIVSTFSDTAAVYSYSGDTSQVPAGSDIKGSANKIGFKKPLEFFWRNEGPVPYPMNWLDEKAHGYEFEDIRNQRYVLQFTPSALKGIFFTVRQLNERWVAVTKYKDQPVAAVFSWAKLTISRWLPPSVDYISLHGYVIKGCAIDYSDKVELKLVPGKFEWELEYGEDPLCACLPSPTCEGPAVVEKLACIKLVSPILRDSVFSAFGYKRWTTHDEKLVVAKASEIEDLYSVEQLLVDSCKIYPDEIPSIIATDIKNCADVLVFDMSIAEDVFIRTKGLRHQNRLHKLSEADALRTLGAPRRKYLNCLTWINRFVSMEEKTVASKSQLLELFDARVARKHATKATDATEDYPLYALVACNIALMMVLLLPRCSQRVSGFFQRCRCCCCKKPDVVQPRPTNVREMAKASDHWGLGALTESFTQAESLEAEERRRTGPNISASLVHELANPTTSLEMSRINNMAVAAQGTKRLSSITPLSSEADFANTRSVIRSDSGRHTVAQTQGISNPREAAISVQLSESRRRQSQGHRHLQGFGNQQAEVIASSKKSSIASSKKSRSPQGRPNEESSHVQEKPSQLQDLSSPRGSGVGLTGRSNQLQELSGSHASGDQLQDFGIAKGQPSPNQHHMLTAQHLRASNEKKVLRVPPVEQQSNAGVQHRHPAAQQRSSAQGSDQRHRLPF